MAKRRGRPTKLTRPLITKICDGVRNGLTNKDAATVSGVSEPTFYRWIERADGADEDPIYREFSKQLKEALSDFQDVHLANIRAAALKTKLKKRKHVKRERMPERYTVDPETGERTLVPGLMAVVMEEIWEDEELPTWQASAWLLERKFPDLYGKMRRIEHEGSIGVKPDLSGLTDEELCVVEQLTHLTDAQQVAFLQSIQAPPPSETEEEPPPSETDDAAAYRDQYAEDAEPPGAAPQPRLDRPG